MKEDFVFDSAEIRRYIPNIMFEAGSERQLSDKLTPMLMLEQGYLERQLLGELEPDGRLLDTCREWIIVSAYSKSVASLDLVLTPNGFGVVSTQTVAPASRERVASLKLSLEKRADDLLCDIVELLRKRLDWRVSPVGFRFCSTMLWSPRPVKDLRTPEENLLNVYDRGVAAATAFELAAADKYLGVELMNAMRETYISGEELIPNRVAWTMAMAVTDFVRKCLGGQITPEMVLHHDCLDPDSHEVFHRLRPVLQLVAYYPQLQALRDEAFPKPEKPDMDHVQGAAFL